MVDLSREMPMGSLWPLLSEGKCVTPVAAFRRRAAIGASTSGQDYVLCVYTVLLERVDAVNK
jgi:hypothetical protein